MVSDNIKTFIYQMIRNISEKMFYFVKYLFLLTRKKNA